MKKLLYTVSLLAAVCTGTGLQGKGGGQAENAAQDLAKFMKILQKHKNEWLKFEMEVHKGKYDLLIAEHDAVFNHKIKNIQKYANSTTQEYNKMVLPEVVTMHKNYMKKWHTLCTSHEKKAKTLHARQMKEVADFENGMGGMQTMETKETYEKTTITE